MPDMERKIQTFRSGFFNVHKEKYRQLKEMQQPSTLLITCSDSRILPDRIFDAKPGELFVVRSAGQLISPNDASIEYALSLLSIDTIIVMGHSACGAMTATQHLDELGSLPMMKHQLNSLSPKFIEGESLDDLIIRNIRLQIEHLKSYAALTHPIKERTIMGLFYKSDTCEFDQVVFDKVNRSGMSAQLS